MMLFLVIPAVSTQNKYFCPSILYSVSKEGNVDGFFGGFFKKVKILTQSVYLA